MRTKRMDTRTHGTGTATFYTYV